MMIFFVAKIRTELDPYDMPHMAGYMAIFKLTLVPIFCMINLISLNFEDVIYLSVPIKVSNDL